MTAALLIVAGAAAAAPSAQTNGDSEESDLQRYRDPEVLAELIEEGETRYMLLDVRTPGEYQREHIPTAVNLPIQILENNPPGVPEERLLIVYCRSGSRSARAAAILKELGYRRVVDFGGITRWEGELE